MIVALGYRAENDSNADRPKSRLNYEEVITSID
jgi:nitroreductase/dihydropteridine reductase